MATKDLPDEIVLKPVPDILPVKISKLPKISKIPQPGFQPLLPIEPPDHQQKLMECQNQRKADKRKSMGLPPLAPYYCKDFDTRDCFFR